MPGLYETVLVCTSLYRSVRVYTGLYESIQVCTSLYRSVMVRTAVSLESLSRLTSLPRWRSRLSSTSIERRCSSVGLSTATWWTKAATTPADRSRGLQTVATTTTLKHKDVSSELLFTQSAGFSQTAAAHTDTFSPKLTDNTFPLESLSSMRVTGSQRPGGGTAEQLTERSGDPAVLFGATSRFEQQLQVPEQQDAGLQGISPLKHRAQLHLRGCRSVSTHTHTVHLHTP